MDFERVDSFPEFNLFFSPNWYSHQIADISPSGLCVLGCNDEVQLLDLQSRRPITSLFIKTPETDKNISDINERKITAVLATEKFIVFSTVSGFLTIFEINSNNIICKFSDCVLQNVQISCIKELKPEECELEMLLTDNKNKIIFAKYKNGILDQLNLEREGNNHSTKHIDIINHESGEQFYAKIMDNGSFNIWTSYFEEVVYNVDIGHIINTASFGRFDGMLIIAMLTRKNQLLICQVGLEKILEEFLREKKFIYTNGNNFRLLVKIEVEVTTPFLPAKSLDKIKLRFHNRVICMNDQRIIITSRDGNMYLTDIESLMKIKEEKLTIKPAAYEENENPFYEMFDENPHFKNIYFSKVIQNTFVAIGMDRLVSFWKITNSKIQYDFNIKCLGSKATRIGFSPLEPQTYLFPCNDKTMRIWNTGKKMNRYVTTILWKGLDKFKVREVEFHPTDESIVTLICEREIALMDVHAHTIISQFYINDLMDGDVSFARWLPREVVEKLIDGKFEVEIKKILKSNNNYKGYLKEKPNTKFTSKFMVVNAKYNKELHKDFLFMTYIQNKGFFVIDFKIGTVFLVNYRIERFVSSVEIVDRIKEKNTIVFFFGDKKGNLIVVRNVGDKFDSVFVDSVHSALISTIRVNLYKLGDAEAKQKQELSEANQSVQDGFLLGKNLIFNDEVQKNLKKNPLSDVQSEVTQKENSEISKQKATENSGRPELSEVYEKDDLIFATGSYDRTIKIFIFKNVFLKKALNSSSLIQHLTFKHKYRISEMDWDPFNHDRLLNVCQKHVTVQVWTINPIKPTEVKAPKSTDNDDDKYCVSNIRGHKGFITAAIWSRNEKNCIITCSDDQSIKIWNLVNIKYQKPPNKKKKETKMGQMIYEEDEEDENSETEYEKKEKKPVETFKHKKNYKDDDFIEGDDEEYEYSTPLKK